MDRIRASLVTSPSFGCESLLIEIREYRYAPTGTVHPAVDIGDFTWQPDVRQLTELRDKINAYLQKIEDSKHCFTCDRPKDDCACGASAVVAPEQAREAKSK